MLLIVVMKGSAMNSKLLKVCAAVMLIVGAGSVWSESTGGESKTRGTFQSASNSVQLAAKVQAVMSVEWGDSTKKFNLYKDSGNVEDVDSRTFSFSTERVGVGYKLKFTGVDGLELVPGAEDNMAWTMKCTNSDSTIRLGLMLKGDGADKCAITSGEREFEAADEGIKKWEIVFQPQEQDSNTEIGTYEGRLKIEILACQ